MCGVSPHRSLLSGTVVARLKADAKVDMTWPVDGVLTYADIAALRVDAVIATTCARCRLDDGQVAPAGLSSVMHTTR